MRRNEWHSTRRPTDGSGPGLVDILGWGRAWFWSAGNARNPRPHLRHTNPLFENVSDCTHFMVADSDMPPAPPADQDDDDDR